MKFIYKKIYLIITVSVCLLIITIEYGLAQSVPIYETESIIHPVVAQNGMVSSQEKLATQAGLQVLKEGGNAIDAAVTVGFALAVTLPRAGNIGGGGFMLIHLANSQENIAIDYREIQ